MPCTDLNSMKGSISLKEGNSMKHSDKRQRMSSSICVVEETKRCNPATAALEAALAQDDFDFLPMEFDIDVGDCLALYSLNEYPLKDWSKFYPCKSRTVQTLNEVTRGMSRMTTATFA